MMRGKPQGTPPAAPAKGFRKGVNKRIVVSFDDETFDEIQALATRNGVSFAEQVRTLCEWGMMEAG